MRSVLIAALGIALPACAGPRGAVPPRPSVLLVTIDTLRADRLGCYGDAQARTPALDGFARQATLFESAFTPAPITLPAHAALMTGRQPPAIGVRGNGGFALPAGVPTLAEALRARGLRTGAFIGGFPLVRRYGLARGFDHYDDDVVKGAGIHFELAERRGDAVVDAALSWLAAQPGPVFLWAHLFDPHAPYDPPAAFATGDPYRDEIAAADAAVGRLLRAWDARSGASVAVVASDHGEAFGEHGEWSHGLFVYDTTLRVPLLVRAAGFPAGRRAATAVGLADVAATIAEAAGPGPALPGASLRGRLAGGVSPGLYAETLLPRLDFGWSDLRGWRDGSLKFIRAPRAELYDVAADPGEEHDLAAARPQELRRLAGSLEAELATIGERDSRVPRDPDAAERLRALGYVQGPGGRGSGADPKDKVALARRIAAATGPFRSNEEAAAVYRELVALDPDNPLLNFRLADALLRASRAEDALAFFRRVTGAGPHGAEAHVGLATALAELGRLDQARAALEEGLRIEPGNAQAHFNLGEIARARGLRDEARRHYQAALGDAVTGARARARLQELR